MSNYVFSGSSVMGKNSRVAGCVPVQFPSNCSTVIYHDFYGGARIPHETLVKFAEHLAESGHMNYGYTFCMATFLEDEQDSWLKGFLEAGWKKVPELSGINLRTGNPLVTVVHRSKKVRGVAGEEMYDYDDGNMWDDD